ncbi:hypothetical protein T09_13221 [Trichinella sp. T9]|nr:hypothetical protein T09_13221 [Trichinella sp. T9]KRZ93058.1 hypothetical protein T08_12543 [Trichinella sp. T8]
MENFVVDSGCIVIVSMGATKVQVKDGSSNKDEISVSQMRIAFIFDTATIKFSPKQSALVK